MPGANAAFSPDPDELAEARELILAYNTGLAAGRAPRAAADAVWALARENEWYREGEGAERFLLAQPGAAKIPVNKAALDLLVAWHGEPLGRLTHDGFEWRWKAQRRVGPALVRETTPGKLPAFIESLLPESWLAQVLHDTMSVEHGNGEQHLLPLLVGLWWDAKQRPLPKGI